MQNDKPEITPDSKLQEIGIPHLDLVLEEVFLLAEGSHEPDALTVSELAAAAGLPLGGLIKELGELLQLAEGIEISCRELVALLSDQGSASVLPLLLDVRERWEFEQAHIPGSLLLSQHELAEILAERRAGGGGIVTVCHHGRRSFSAAMYLRQEGFLQASSLAGGVDAWARHIDPEMRRY